MSKVIQPNAPDVKRPRQSHPSLIASKASVNYCSRMLGAALDDPAVSDYVSLYGGMMPDRQGREIEPIQLRRGLNERNPATGKRMRKRVNGATRMLKGFEINNRCRGWHATFALDKSISTAAFLFDDTAVRDLGYQALLRAGKSVSRKIQRRIRKGGANHEMPTGVGIVFAVPEKVSRYGDPHLHMHHVFCNVTEFQESGETFRCAAHFQQVAAFAGEAYRQANLWLFRQLGKQNYIVDLVDGRTCRLSAVPGYICRQLSQGAKVIENELLARGVETAPPITSLGEARRRRNAYKKVRPAKKLEPLAEWQTVWASRIGVQEIVDLKRAYYEERYYSEKIGPAVIAPRVVAGEPLGAIVSPVLIAPKNVLSPSGVVSVSQLKAGNDDGTFASLRELSTGFRLKIANECRGSIECEQIEVKYEYAYCEAECERKLPCEAELIRKILNALLPRLRIRVEPRDELEPKLTLKPAGVGQDSLGKIVQQIGESFQAEFRLLLRTRSFDDIIAEIHRVLPAELFVDEAEVAQPPQVDRSAQSESVNGTPLLPGPETEAWEMLP